MATTKKVSDSFMDCEMLSDSALSEDYDNDPYYFGFDEVNR